MFALNGRRYWYNFSMNIILLLIFLLFLFSMSAAFSGSEAAFFSISPWRLKRLEKEGNKAASMATVMLQRPEKLLIVILLGNETVNSMISQLGAIFNRKINIGHDPANTLYATVISAGLLIIFGEITPKAVALKQPMRFIKKSRHILNFWSRISGILASNLEKVTNRIISKGSFYLRHSDVRDRVQKELGRYISLGESEGAINTDEGHLMRNISSLDILTARDVITPRHLLAAVDVGSSAGEALNVIRDRHHSRLLVYDGDIDNVIGKVILKDLLQFIKTGYEADASLRNMIHPVIHVPDQISLRALLVEMQRRRETMAVIFDEYGGTLGLVTLEDVIEEVVGDIKDDSAQEKDIIRRIDDGSFIVSSAALIRDLQREIGLQKNIRFSGLHGYLAHLFGKIPGIGDTATDGKFRYKILSAERQRIGKVQITRITGFEAKERAKE